MERSRFRIAGTVRRAGRPRAGALLVLVAVGIAFAIHAGFPHSRPASGTALASCTASGRADAQLPAGCADPAPERPGMDGQSDPPEPLGNPPASVMGADRDARDRWARSSEQHRLPGAETCRPGLRDHPFGCGSQIRLELTDAGAKERASRSIAGRVMTRDGVGLQGVTVLAAATRLDGDADRRNAPANTLRYRTVTDPVGFYAFHGLAGGDYLIQSSAHGPFRSARINVRAGVQYADLVVAEDQTIIVQGRVLSADGEPLEGVTVLPIVLGVPSVLTDQDGVYRLPVDMKPDAGRLSLRFQRPGFVEHREAVPIINIEGAQPPPVDVVMQPVEYWTAVTGTVKSVAGSPLAERTVELRPMAQQRRYRATTDAEGHFVFPAVEAPLAYRLAVSGAPDHKDHHEQLRITADEAQLDISVEPFEFGEVAGRLVNLDGSPIPNFALVVRNTASAAPNALVNTDADGNFAIPAAPAGDLVIASQAAPSILVRGLHLKPGDRMHVPLVLDWGEHEIRGLVVDRHGNPMPASRIVLSWFHQGDEVTSRVTRRTAADAQGTFLFSDLGPGPHRLEVNAPGFRSVAMNHDASRQGYELTVRLN